MNKVETIKVETNKVETMGNSASTAVQKRNAVIGFTLIELVITLAVGAILLGLAFPSFSAILHKNRINSAAINLYVALNTARNEAVKKRSAVSVCPSADGSACVTSNIDWSVGWIVFDDVNGDGARQSSEAIITVSPAPHSQVEMQAGGAAASFVRFNSTGDASTTSGEFRICHSNSIVYSKLVSVSLVGRIESTERTLADCNASS